MKIRSSFIILALLSLLTAVSIAAADGNGSQNYYPPQTYPVPQYYPNGQQQDPCCPYYPPNTPYYPYYPYGGGQQGPIQPYSPQQPNYTPTPIPYYEPYSPINLYPVGGDDNIYFFDPVYEPGQPVYPGNPGNGGNQAQVSRQWNYDGSLSLTWTIRNVTNETWDRKNVDIKCISGCHVLKNPSQTLWDIPYTVKRNELLSFSVDIWNPGYNQTMTFSMVAGSKTLYTFSINTN